MHVTIKKIAELSGVSVGTVDRVLNKRGKVNVDVEKRVLSIAMALNYKPNSVAKILALRSKEFKVGVVSHVQENYINYAVNECFRGLHAGESEHSDFGVTLLFRYSKNFDVESQLALIDELMTQGICALAILPINNDIIGKKLDDVISKGIPVFCLINDVTTANKHYYLGADNSRIGSIAAGLFNLLSKEPINIAIVVPSLSLSGNVFRLKSFENTIKNYTNFAKEIAVCVATNDDFYSYTTVKEMLASHSNINAIFFASGAVEGGMQAINEANLFGKAIIISIDASDTIRQNIINGNVMATINQNTYEVGYKAIKIIFDFITLSKLPDSSNIYVNSELLIKEHFIN